MKPIEIPELLKHGNIIEHFEWAVRKVPNKAAIIDKSESITFLQLHQRVLGAQQKLQDSGLKSGDRVLVFIPMSIDLYVGVLALFRMGCTAVFLDEWSKIGRLKLACQIADCQGFLGFSLSRFFGWFIGDIRKIPIWISSRNLGLNSGNRSTFEYNSSPDLAWSDTSEQQAEYTSPETKNERNPDFELIQKNRKIERIDKINETALITFTTGSTGVPKAAKRTHAFLHQQFLALQKSLKTSEDVVDMPVLPIVLLINLGMGVSSVLAQWNSRKPQKLEVKKVIDRIEKYGVNRIIASPYFIDRMSRYIVENNIKISSISKVFSGGAPVFPSASKEWMNAFSNAEIYIVYGSTEAEPISMIAAQDLSKTDIDQSRGLCVGRVEEVAQVRIVNWESGEVAEMGKVGEIQVSGKHVLREYFGPYSATWISESKIFEGSICWHRTGDAGFIGTDGNLYLVGRCSQIIKTAANTIYPFIVEEQLRGIDAVAAGTVMELDGSLVYFIELEHEIKLDEQIHLKVETKIEELNLPKGSVLFLKLPRDPRHFSKIDYSRLKLLSRGY